LRVVLAIAGPAGRVLSAVDARALLAGVSLAVGLLASLTCTVGNLAAYWQRNLKRLLAYSSIAHAGYMLMAGAILISRTNAGVGAVVAYLMVYLFMNLGAFGAVGLIYWATNKETIEAYSGLGRRAPWLAVCLAVCLFSLIGVPPMGGFVVKYWLLVALFGHGLYWLLLVAVFNTLLSLFYYLRVVKAMFLTDDGQPPVRVPLAGRAIVGLCAAAILLTGTLLIGPLKNSSDALAARLYPPGPTGQSPPQVALEARR
ncbi:MAG: NADH-quinone oxidoreductase subunit N, partial [Phycisphaerae bacterium]